MRVEHTVSFEEVKEKKLPYDATTNFLREWVMMNIKTPGFSVSREKGDMGRISEHLEEPCELIAANMGECEYILQNFIPSICPFLCV